MNIQIFMNTLGKRSIVFIVTALGQTFKNEHSRDSITETCTSFYALIPAPCPVNIKQLTRGAGFSEQRHHRQRFGSMRRANTVK